MAVIEIQKIVDILAIYERLPNAVHVLVMIKVFVSQSLNQVFYDLDRRPNAPGQQYPMYADGHRMTSTLRRDEWYCPSCKQN